MKRQFELRVPFVGVVVLVACSSSPSALDGSTGHADEQSEGGSEPDASETDASSESGEVPDPSVDECDGFSQDCPAGQKCVPFGTTGELWDATKCVDVSGDRAPGEPCTWAGYAEATDDCDQTSACFEGVCRAFCTGTADSPGCPGEGQCLLTPVLNFCIDPCDPFGDDCPADEGCYLHDGEFICLPRSGDAGSGEICGYTNDCPSGHRCVQFLDLDGPCGGIGCCFPYCELDDPEACVAVLGTICEPVFDGSLGLCNVPD